MGTKFDTSEHHYQFKKLKFHDKGVEAYDMLLQEDSFKAMKIAKDALPDDEVSDAWTATAKEEMLQSNCMKYASCPHTREKLLGSCLTLVEATGDPFWGIGLNVTQTLECLSDYWPGQNVMGSVLMEVHDKIQKQQLSVTDKCQDEGKKRKAGSYWFLIVTKIRKYKVLSTSLDGLDSINIKHQWSTQFCEMEAILARNTP